MTIRLTTQALVERSLGTWARRVAIVDGDRTATFADLDRRSARLANAVLAAGAGRDDPVATFLPNRLEFLEVDVACARAGAPRLGISDRLSADEARHMLADAGAAVLVVDGERLERLEGQVPECVRAILVVGAAPALPPAARGYEETLTAAAPRLTARTAAPADVNYILYTSGTTGRPKGAAHSHASRVAAMANMLASELQATPDSAMLHAAPLTHGSGSKALTFLAAGARNVILPRFTPEGFAQAIRDERATHTFLVPTMIQRLTEAPPPVVRATASLQQISFGGAPISPTLFRRALDAFGPVLTQVYGSCEAPHPITVLRPHDIDGGDVSDRVLTSAGRAAAGVELRLVDDAGADVPPGAVGELVVRAPHLMLGYWGNEPATREVLDADGRYHAGDLATLDEDGLITFQDRKRDLIISGGLNVYPSEVERVIAAHPAVRQVAVVGAPDDEWGEAVVAYVVASDASLSAADVIAWSRARLAAYKKPRHVVFRESLPLGASNKVLKKELRELLWDGRERNVN